MIDLRDLQALPEADEAQAQQMIFKLLNCWSIPRAYSTAGKADYDFLVQNEPYFKTLLSLCGYTLHITRTPGEEVAYLESAPAGSRRKVSKPESIVLLRLLQAYLEARTKISLSGGGASITAEDLLHAVNATSKAPMDLKSLFDILDTLADYHLVLLPGRKNERGESTVIGIMPSISCLLPNTDLETIEATLQAYAKETSRRRSAGGPLPAETDAMDGETPDVHNQEV